MTNTIKLFILFLLTISNICFAVEDKYSKKNYYSDNEIEISYQYKNCEYLEQFNKEFVILEIVNKTSKEIQLSWKELLWYDNNCINCEQEEDEFRKEIVLKGKETLIGDCNSYNNLRIFSKLTEKLENMPGVRKESLQKMTGFEIKNIRKVENE